MTFVKSEKREKKWKRRKCVGGYRGGGGKRREGRGKGRKGKSIGY